MASDLGRHIEIVARAVWGAPNTAQSTRGELRWGWHGARSVDLAKGVWCDHGQEHASINAGGVLDLIRRERGGNNADAFRWMRDELHLDVGEANGAAAGSAKRVDRGELAATYDYVDETCDLVSQTLRYEKPPANGGKPAKTFLQRRPDGAGDWIWSLGGVKLIPYRLPELIEAIALERRVFVVEGEKAVERLRALNVTATCNPMGAKKWPPHFAKYFAGAIVAILPDNDQPGLEHAEQWHVTFLASRPNSRSCGNRGSATKTTSSSGWTSTAARSSGCMSLSWTRRLMRHSQTPTRGPMSLATITRRRQTEARTMALAASRGAKPTNSKRQNLNSSTRATWFSPTSRPANGCLEAASAGNSSAASPRLARAGRQPSGSYSIWRSRPRSRSAANISSSVRRFFSSASRTETMR
jgi:hypothetical protein